ncbi:MAG: ArsA family ATPase [Armatimonadetes bacterium]|nr:ArsA family ATPase [Armatimonadota bacterium]
MPSFLTDPRLRLWLFGGKGGVGKTTCAVATALTMAAREPNERFLLMSVDPAHSVLDSLAGSAPPPNLSVVEFTGERTLDVLRRRYGAAIERILTLGTFMDGEDAHRIVGVTVPAPEELAAVVHIAHWVETRKYRGIVVDLAPTGHALRLLDAPKLLVQWADALDKLLEKHREMRSAFGAAARPDLLDALIARGKAMGTLARSTFTAKAGCRFAAVANADALTMAETLRLVAELRRRRIPVTDIVINRMHGSECAVCLEQRQSEEAVLRANAEQLSAQSLWELPILAGEARGRPILDGLWEQVKPLAPAAPPEADATAPAAFVRTVVENPAPEPGRQRFIFLAGKGGVGKTTMACATALDLAADEPPRSVLLLSTDPAHSLADALGMAVGDAAGPVSDRLSAMQLSPADELAALRRDVRRGLKPLRSASSSFSIAFESEAWDKLLDLCPPGIDEIMAITRITATAEAGRFDTIVVDTAPTGHLLHLLRMPAVMQEWLQAALSILLKYDAATRAPDLADRLIRLSRDLKGLRAALDDPAEAAIYAVAIPTRMALAETIDLVQETRSLGIDVPLLLVNHCTPATECPRCGARRIGEQEVLAEIDGRFGRTHVARIPQMPGLRGAGPLLELGRALYGGPAAGAQAEPSGNGEGKCPQ